MVKGKEISVINRTMHPNLALLATVLLFLFMLCSLSSANACEVATSFFKDGVLTDSWGVRAAIALGVSLLIVALFYMIGKGIGSPELTNRAKTDLNQVIISAVIITIFASFILGTCAIDATQLGLPRSSLFDNSRAYFEYSTSKAIEAYVKTANSIMLIGGLSSIYTRASLWPSWLGMDVSINVMPFAGLNSALNSLQFMMNLVLTTVAISSAWLAVLTAIETAFLQLLLPAGILLRCFMPTRELGGVLIAISIGIFIFYPLLFSLSYMLIGAPSAVGAPGTSYLGTVTAAYIPLVAAGVIPYAGSIAISAEYFTMINKSSDTIIESMKAIGETLLAIFILPALNWVILAEIVRSMSRSLGEEVDISSLARMV